MKKFEGTLEAGMVVFTADNCIFEVAECNGRLVYMEYTRHRYNPSVYVNGKWYNSLNSEITEVRSNMLTNHPLSGKLLWKKLPEELVKIEDAICRIYHKVKVSNYDKTIEFFFGKDKSEVNDAVKALTLVAEIINTDWNKERLILVELILDAEEGATVVVTLAE